ncbi:beta-ketoacyl-[acyl-carrier-protein] synthase III [Flavobacteriaceae bacterium UJ101]|nr:beta-ketoacyl-[acyl-carrier-protein] synthase III [Flavobacteriaceae bacterium UJ101]
MFKEFKMSRRTVIKGSGSYLPENIIQNKDFLNHTFYTEEGTLFEKDNEEIIEKFESITEIRERRYVSDDMMNSDMATIAAKRAIEDAKIDIEELDYIIFAHNYGNVTVEKHQTDILPSLSARVKHNLGIKNRKCIPYDMNFGCPGWIQGMILMDQLGKANIVNKALVIGSETLSRITDPHDRNAMIFADGAGAVVIEMENSTDKGIINYATISDMGEELNFITNDKSVNPDYEGSDVNISMKGRKVYEYVLKNVPYAIKEVIDTAGLTYTDISKFLIHQANAKMDHAILQRLERLYGIKGDGCTNDVMPMTIQTLGNSSVATVPTMYDLMMKGQLEGQTIKENEYMIFASVGAGMNINAFLYKT